LIATACFVGGVQAQTPSSVLNATDPSLVINPAGITQVENVYLSSSLIAANNDAKITVSPTLYGSISGIVFTPDGKTPVAGASVTTNPPTSAIATDTNGEFAISKVTVGNYTVTASKTGYEPTSVAIAVGSGGTVQAVIFLSTSSSNVPSAPTDPSPADQAADQPVSVALSWHNPAAASGNADTTRFNVYLYQSGSNITDLIASDIADTTTTVSNLRFNTTYFWQVVAKGTDTISTNGNVWSFTTMPLPDNPYVFARMVDGNYQIFSSDSGAANVVRLTNDNYRDWWPRFNPRHDVIAFTSDANVDPQIYTMNLDGSNVFQVTTVGVTGYGNNGTGFGWSPDGAYLIYGHNNNLYRINSDGSGLTLIATAPAGMNFTDCSYSPQGNKIVALAVGPNLYDSEIYLMNLDGSDTTLLVPETPGVTASPSFSIDGNKVLYTHDVSGYEDNEARMLDSHIFEIDINTKQTFDLSANTQYTGDSKPDGTNDLYPRYSPDGAYIIFENAPNTPGSQGDIWVMSSSANGSNDNSRHMLIQNGAMPDWK
jgi:TolB protein